MGGISGLNHLTLSVANLDRSLAFYSGLLGLAIRWRGPAAAYLETETLWLALVVDADVRRGALPEYSHAAFSVAAPDLPDWISRLTEAGVVKWQESERGDSFYFLDPDGHKLELHSGNLKGRFVSKAAGES